MLKAILFDLGDTLIYNPYRWAPFMERANQALGETICAYGLAADSARFGETYAAKLGAYMAEREQTLVERSTAQLLTELLAEEGHPNPPGEAVRAALDAFYSITRQNWEPETDALFTLQALHARGLRLGLLSNAGDDKDVRILVEKVGATPLFDFILTSAACGVRKPHPHIFQKGLAHWAFDPAEVAMVGDRLDADVGGANRAGLVSIWIKRRVKSFAIGPDAPRPAFVIEALGEILGILDQA